MHLYHQLNSFHFISFQKFEGQITILVKIKYCEAEDRRTLNVRYRNLSTYYLKNFVLFYTKIFNMLMIVIVDDMHI